ncbi:MAG: Gfo/Idh/MocA family oxidoreductase [Planctomycetota bacterium]|nr:MAG: Gfo/Idh/MocA family oxidoreductase [Planctomycetota bacterium]
MRALQQGWPRPRNPRPIVVIGAGGIVRSAHLPAYRKLGFPVAGIFDVRPASAQEVARKLGVRRVFRSVEDAGAAEGVVFDLAVPAGQVLEVLRALPAGAAVLIQKPLGRDLAEARRIAALCRRKRLLAAVNFQLRFAPNMLALADGVRRGMFGEVVDVEVRVNTCTGWDQWSFLRGIPRLEIVYHSIHYLDLVRRLVGEPHGVKAWAGAHPRFPGYADTRSSVILDYGRSLRVSVQANHAHAWGGRHAVSELKLEGTRGAALARMGVNLDYPRGRPDALEIARNGAPWRRVPLRGSWFIAAFEGPMSNLQRHASGEDEALLSPVADAVKTMALVEACYRSAARPGTLLR